MADGRYVIRQIDIQGFRAYLKPKTFDFSKKRCAAIFAPNGSGKSSIVDALEFMFSSEGTLDRLGRRASNNNAGVGALAHNLSDDHGINPCVSIDFLKGREPFTCTRVADPGGRTQSAAVAAVANCFVVSPIIRGHELRRFVEDRTPEQRYTDIATWLQLGPLVDVQKNLRTLRLQLQAAVKDTSTKDRINIQIGKETGNGVTFWRDYDVLNYLNAVVVSALDKTLQLKTLDRADQIFLSLCERAKEEERQIGLDGLRQIRKMAVSLYHVTTDANTGKTLVDGAIPAFEAAVRKKSDAADSEAAERVKAADAAFSALWKSAEPLFAEGATVLNICPVCATPLSETQAGSMVGVRTHLAEHLGELAEYAKAKKALDDATAEVKQEHVHLLAALPNLSNLLSDGYDVLKAANTAYLTAVRAWNDGAVPDFGDFALALDALLGDLNRRIAEIEVQQGEHTYTKAKAKIERVLDLRMDYMLAERTSAELQALSKALTSQAALIGAEIRKKILALLDTLLVPTNEIYHRIQADRAVPIRLELPPEEDANQQRLNLLIDFAPNRTSVQPTGYLSDSQIHSLALAFRLAAIKQFNFAAPIVVLDDIVTSYDADHRRTIAGAIADTCGDCQVIITTHDELFFKYMKDQLRVADWQFTQITKLDPEFGPRFADHKVTQDMIKSRWDFRESAANEIRQAEEEWLLEICRAFGVTIRIRLLEKAHSYERGELASALAKFLNETKLTPRPVTGVKNRFLTSLQQGVIENFGSHFQDGPYGQVSIGDEQRRWDEFNAFRSQFVCPACGRTKFKRPPDVKKPICANETCEAQFEFAAAAEAVSKEQS